MALNRREILAVGAGVAAGGIAAAKPAAAAINSIPRLADPHALRLVTFAPPGEAAARIGVVLDDGHVLDAGAEARRQGLRLDFDPAAMLSLISAGSPGLDQMQTLVRDARRAGAPLVNEVRLLSPIPRPQANIYAVGWNYLDHFEEGRAARQDKAVQTYPSNPVFFSKAVHTMNGPFDPIPYDPTNSTMVDWEAELAVVIGRRGRNITEAQAMDHVFGFAAYNDTTLRDVQQKRHGGQWFKGKSTDRHGPMGPWLVTAPGLDLDQARIICRVNGVEKQNASYQQMFFKIPRVIAELSRGLTLEAGDIIATGTPSGVGFGRTPPEFLKPGDVMESEITGIGVIRNTIEQEAV